MNATTIITNRHNTIAFLFLDSYSDPSCFRVDEIKSKGIDPQEIAMIGLRSFSRQLMQAGIFHADPHPGNTLVMHDGRVSLVDFGIVGYLDEETMLQIANVFLGF